MFRLSFFAISFWFLIGLSGGWWLHEIYNENALRYAPGLADNERDDANLLSSTNEVLDEPARPKPKVDNIQQWLKNNDYDKIMAHYAVLVQQDIDPQNKQRIRIALLNKIKNQLGKNPEYSLQLLNKYQKIDAYDPMALFLMAQALLANKNYMLAIKTAIDLNNFVQDEIDKEQIAILIDEVELQYSEFLNKTGRTDKLLELYQVLTTNNYQTNPAYYYRLAEVQQKLALYDEALATLSGLSYDPVWGERARDLAIGLQQKLELKGGIKVPVEQEGGHFIVTSRINGIDGIRLLIDTGATLSSLRPNVARSIGVDIDDNKRAVINLAVGVANAIIAHVDQIEIGEARLNDLKINVIEMPVSIKEDGLLGMNFLGRFKWLIDDEENILYLEAK